MVEELIFTGCVILIGGSIFLLLDILRHDPPEWVVKMRMRRKK